VWDSGGGEETGEEIRWAGARHVAGGSNETLDIALVNIERIIKSPHTSRV
jgi:hypothetical protein